MENAFTDIHFGTLRHEWLLVSEEVFHALKDHFGLRETWHFSISSPDPDPRELLDDRGTAAWALRRIQAVRFLLARPEEAGDLRLALEYLSGLTYFMYKVLDAQEEGLGVVAIRKLADLNEQLVARLISLLQLHP